MSKAWWLQGESDFQSIAHDCNLFIKIMISQYNLIIEMLSRNSCGQFAIRDHSRV